MLLLQHLIIIFTNSMIQLGKQVWSSPFPVDFQGTNVSKICIAPNKVIIIFVKVHDLTATQKQVSILFLSHCYLCCILYFTKQTDEFEFI